MMMEKLETKIILLASIGMFLTVLNFGIMNVALPPLQMAFHTTTSILSWTVSIYVLLLSCTILLFGKLSDKLGTLRIYSYGFLIFFIGSLFCSLAPNIGVLIAARAIQGIGAAMIQANAFALITSQVPEHKRVKALSLLGIAMGLGPILGPALGGVIISVVSWRWIFFINLPICIWGFFEASAIKDNLVEKSIEKLPAWQLGTFSLAIVSLLFGLFNIGSDNMLASLLVLSAILLAALYLCIEKRSEVNIVPLSLFSHRYFSMPLIGIMVFGFCSAAIFMLPPFMFENYLHFSPWQVGIIGLICPLGFLIGAQLTVKINQHLTMEQSTLLGLVLMLVSLMGLLVAQMTLSLMLYYAMLFIFGFGGVLFQIVALNMIMKYQKVSLHGTVGAIIRMFQNITVAIGTTASALFIQHFNKGISGYADMWTLTVALVLITVLAHAIFFNVRKKPLKSENHSTTSLSRTLTNSDANKQAYQPIDLDEPLNNLINPAHQQLSREPTYIIVSQTLSEEQLLFKLKKTGSTEILMKTAQSISLDEGLIGCLSSKDAHLVGYVSASERMLLDIRWIDAMKTTGSFQTVVVAEQDCCI